MLNFSEFKKTPDRLSDLLPWGFLVAPGVILNKDGSFLSTLRYRGPDLDSSTEAELRSRAFQLNNVLKRFGSGWAIYAEARKVPAKRYPNSEFPEPISFLIEEERRALFEEGEQHDSAYYLTLIYLPPSDAVNKVSAFFIEKEKSGINYGDILETYQVEVSRVLELLRSLFTEVGQLDEDELLTYLHSTVSPKLHPVRAPEMFAYLDGLLVDSPLITGLRPRLGDCYLRTISVMGFPPFSEPGFLDALNQLNFPYRWVTRYVALEKDEAEKELRKYRKQWFAKRKGIVTLMKEAFTHSESSMIDSDALRKSEDADEALTELGCDAVSYGFFSTSIVLWEEDQKLLTERVRQVERVLNSLGFTTKDESINAVDAWLGSIPGNVRNNIRRPLLSSLNLSHLFPFSATWNGPEKDNHFKQ